ncbi:MAG: hypothetical protein MRJ65_03075 [Candidatus Brocadiaceae bacterium]|nr:hypothetical protein [Candidatus Brocadiaceae bacterium]
MNTCTSGITTLFLITCISTSVFATNAGKTDWGFESKNYAYALIEGEITSIDHNKNTLQVKGTDEQLFFCEHTEFFRGDISLPVERVFHAVTFKKDQKIQAVHVTVGDMIKSRYGKDRNGKIYLDICLVGKKKKPLYSRDKISENILAEN